MASLLKTLRPLIALAATIAAVAATLGTLGTSSSARTAQAAPTELTATYSGTALRLKVDSPKAACERERRVFLVVAFGAQGGAGVYETDDRGILRLPAGGAPPRDAKALSYAARTPACQLAQSNVVTIPAGEVEMRAAAKARTTAKVTYTGSGLRVKVASPTASCVKNRKVDVIAYQNGSEFAQLFAGTTDARGVFRYQAEAQSGGASTKVIAFVRTTTACNVGQSPIISVS